MLSPAVPISPNALTRVLCVDDFPDSTTTMRLSIESDPTMRCVGCLASADHLLEWVRRHALSPDVVLLDASMPGKNPLEALRELDAAFPHIRTIILSGHDDAAFIDRVFAAGAWGYVSKGDEPDTVLQAVREVAKGNVWRPKRPHQR